MLLVETGHEVDALGSALLLRDAEEIDRKLKQFRTRMYLVMELHLRRLSKFCHYFGLKTPSPDSPGVDIRLESHTYCRGYYWPVGF
jgi:hypothetical protein